MTRNDRLLYLSLPLIGLFAYTALSKLLAPEVFREALLNQPLPEGLSLSLVWAIPLAELLAVGLLLYAPWRKWGFVLSGGLMLLFTGYVSLVVLGYLGERPCSCGGILERLSWEQHLLVNLLFYTLSLWGGLLALLPSSSTSS
ncbi:MauE/DoxX family redox-associated membrane protein [Cesiribacter andamanensis]|uniref:Methylamine utilisation protein MauE domain-containing protein n=1 Tax=Cesiribacter andamanensis AMV16 TaxID=1279009 RepID=M7NGF9_9BACT|nr:MauE/DoxX family redox-associated membrane protein [Cesiribacter andamanensis]EMR00915.1 hypothetical protein ADICEAN_03962 [Cesiribacter andamanensis AMV16]